MPGGAIVSVVEITQSHKEPAMYSLDQNLNVALDRVTQRVCAVQAVEMSQNFEPASQTRREPRLVAALIFSRLISA